MPVKLNTVLTFLLPHIYKLAVFFCICTPHIRNQDCGYHSRVQLMISARPHRVKSHYFLTIFMLYFLYFLDMDLLRLRQFKGKQGRWATGMEWAKCVSYTQRLVLWGPVANFPSVSDADRMTRIFLFCRKIISAKVLLVY